LGTTIHQRRNLYFIYNEKESEIIIVLFRIGKIVMELPTKQRNEAVENLKKFLCDLKPICRVTSKTT